MTLSLISNPTMEKGKLVSLRAGRYPVVDATLSFLETTAAHPAILLEWQGSRPEGESCWYALVKDHTIVVWEDQLETDVIKIC